jgi:hypothetical protein
MGIIKLEKRNDDSDKRVPLIFTATGSTHGKKIVASANFCCCNRLGKSLLELRNNAIIGGSDMENIHIIVVLFFWR